MAKQLIIQNKLISPLQHYLETIDLRSDFISFDIDFQKLYDQYSPLFAELEDELGISFHKFAEADLRFSFDLLHLQPTDYHIFFEPEYHFNRYRLKTLRTSFYQDIQFFDVQKWRSYCRSKEKEAFKAGLTHEIWTNTLAEELLGTADDPGYFGGTGSPGWKLHAIANFCLDLYCRNYKFRLIRLSDYDSFMREGKIELLGNSLKLRRHERAIQQMLSRKMNYKIPEEEKNNDISSKKD